jgi:microcin C transport system permease protein
MPKGRPKGWLSPTNQRRWANFKANRRGYWSLWIFMILFIAACWRRVHCQ